jgi:hypothetical protein
MSAPVPIAQKYRTILLKALGEIATGSHPDDFMVDLEKLSEMEEVQKDEELCAMLRHAMNAASHRSRPS